MVCRRKRAGSHVEGPFSGSSGASVGGTGGRCQSPGGGGRRSGRIEQHRDQIHGVLAERTRASSSASSSRSFRNVARSSVPRGSGDPGMMLPAAGVQIARVRQSAVADEGHPARTEWHGGACRGRSGGPRGGQGTGRARRSSAAGHGREVARCVRPWPRGGASPRVWVSGGAAARTAVCAAAGRA